MGRKEGGTGGKKMGSGELQRKLLSQPGWNLS